MSRYPAVAKSLPEPITVTFKTAAALTGLCESKIQKMVYAGEIENVKVGTRRLVIFASLKKLLTPSDSPT
jgi:excisionase family DNA binding protein